mgnify:CR=1 FL=1
MEVGCLMLDEKRGEYVIFLGYNQWNEIVVMDPNGFIYQGCELRFKEV